MISFIQKLLSTNYISGIGAIVKNKSDKFLQIPIPWYMHKVEGWLGDAHLLLIHSLETQTGTPIPFI